MSESDICETLYRAFEIFVINPKVGWKVLWGLEPREQGLGEEQDSNSNVKVIYLRWLNVLFTKQGSGNLEMEVKRLIPGMMLDEDVYGGSWFLMVGLTSCGAEEKAEGFQQEGSRLICTVVMMECMRGVPGWCRSSWSRNFTSECQHRRFRSVGERSRRLGSVSESTEENTRVKTLWSFTC